MKRIIYIALIVGTLAVPMLTQALTVGPVKLEYSVQPGDTVRGEMIVQNEENIERTFYPSSERFIEVNGEKRFSKDENNLSSWFVMQSSITLKPTEQRVIPFTINIPSNADPGGHYAVIWWSTASPQESPATAGGDRRRSIAPTPYPPPPH